MGSRLGMRPAVAALTWPVGVAQGAAVCQARCEIQAQMCHSVPSWPEIAAQVRRFLMGRERCREGLLRVSGPRRRQEGTLPRSWRDPDVARDELGERAASSPDYFRLDRLQSRRRDILIFQIKVRGIPRHHDHLK